MANISKRGFLADTGAQTIRLFKVIANRECTSGRPSPTARQVDRFANQADRFELWAINLGLMVTGSGSLDYRLRENETLTHAIGHFLTDLNDALKEVAEFYHENGPNTTGSGSRDAQNINLEFDDVKNTITRLLQISTFIRNTSSRTLNGKFVNYQEVDADSGRDLFDEYYEFDLDYVKSIFSEFTKVKSDTKVCSEASVRDEVDSSQQGLLSLPQTGTGYHQGVTELIQRLARANVLRRRKFGYWKAHYNKLSHHHQSAILKQSVGEEDEVPKDLDTSENPFVPSVTTATELNVPQEYQHENHSNYTLSEYHHSEWRPGKDVVVFPDQPNNMDDESHIQCPYCFTFFSVKRLRGKSWHAHLIHDLRPYICTYQSCGNPDLLYDSRSEWIQHEQTHRQKWQCPEHPDIPFDRLASFNLHLETEHAECADDGVRDNHPKISETSELQPDRCCPVCSMTSESSATMDSHIALHLERFAMFSLPSSVETDLKEEESFKESAVALASHAGAENSESRSTNFVAEYDHDSWWICCQDICANHQAGIRTLELTCASCSHARCVDCAGAEQDERIFNSQPSSEVLASKPVTLDSPKESITSNLAQAKVLKDTGWEDRQNIPATSNEKPNIFNRIFNLKSRNQVDHPWSTWEWNSTYKCYSRFRKVNDSKNDYVFEYSADPRGPRSGGAVDYNTVPYGSELLDDPNLADLGTGANNQYTHGASTRPESLQAIDIPGDSASYHDVDTITSRLSNSRISENARWENRQHIRAASNEKHERFDRNYKIHHESEFKPYTLFKILWSEPRGNDSTGATDATISVREKGGKREFAKVRRFMIIAQRRGHCLCLPINTYGRQGAMKSGVNAYDHTIVFHGSQPIYMPGEWEKGMTRAPIRIEMQSSREKLDEYSRLNYSKIYTVECNVRVCFIGKVDKKWRQEVAKDYNATHPPVDYISSPSASLQATNDFMHAIGGEPSLQYQQSYHSDQGLTEPSQDIGTLSPLAPSTIQSVDTAGTYGSSVPYTPSSYHADQGATYPLVRSSSYDINTQQSYRHTDTIDELLHEGTHDTTSAEATGLSLQGGLFDELENEEDDDLYSAN